MSTRSLICKELPNGKYRTIYCHWDGYLDHNGVILNDIYDTEEKVDKLLDLGNLSSLRVGLEPGKLKEHSFENPQENVCIAYGRDRGESDQEAKELTLKELFENTWIEYFYIFTKNNEWIYSTAYFPQDKLEKETEETLMGTFKELSPEIDKICPIEDRKHLKDWSIQ